MAACPDHVGKTVGLMALIMRVLAIWKDGRRAVPTGCPQPAVRARLGRTVAQLSLYSVLVGALLGAPVARAQPTITLTSGEWLPYMSEQLAHYGPVSRIVSEAFALEGVKVRYLFRPWKRALVEAEQGDVNGSILWSVGTAGSSRERLFYFSDVVIESKQVFFHLKRVAFDWHSFADLEHVAIGGAAGYEYPFESNAQIKIDRAATDDVNFHKLLAGRFTIFPADLNGGKAILKKHFAPQEVERITYHPQAFDATRYHLILSRKAKQNAHYLYLFNRGLARLRASGKYAQYIEEMERGDY